MAQTSLTLYLPSPSRCPEGQGVRRLDCQYYAQCLAVAAQKNWPGFSCQYCKVYTPDPGWQQSLISGRERWLLSEIFPGLLLDKDDTTSPDTKSED